MRMFLVTVLLCGWAIQTVSAQADWRARRYGGEGVHIRIGRSYVLAADQISTRAVVVIGGSATIDGRAEEDIIVIGGPVRVGPAAQVRGDLVAVGGELIVADTAQIAGEVREVNVFWPEWRIAVADWWWGVDDGWWAVFSLLATIVRLAMVMFGACLLALLAPRWIRRLERTASDAPLASGVLGAMLQVLFLPLLVITIIGMIITIIGIPLLVLVPFALGAFALLWLAGFAGVAAQLGGRLRGTMTGVPSGSPVLDTACGVALLGLVSLVGSVLAVGPWPLTPPAAAFSAAGFVIEYLAWTVGLGAALIAPFQRRWPSTPPPLTAHAPSTAPA